MPSGDDVTGRRPLDLRLLIPALVAWASLAWLITGPAALLAGLAGAFVALGLVVLLTLRHRRGAGLAALTALATAAVLVAGAAHGAMDRAGPVPGLAAERAVVDVRGLVLTEPRAVARPPGQPDLVVLRMRIEQVSGRGHESGVRTPVVVFADEAWAGVSWRGRVQAYGRLSPAEPGSDSMAVFAPLGPPVSLDRPGPVLAAAELARERLRAAVGPIPADARGLIPGLVIGDTSLTPPDLTEAMLVTGMTHLSAVSGSNVAIVVGAVVLCCGWLGVERRWRPPVAVVAIVLFVILCRPEPSVMRAAVMGTVALLGLTTYRRRASLPALATAVLGLLCFDPWMARSYGFALSTLATLGLVVFARPWGEAMARRLPRRLRLLGYAVSVPLAAQVTCAPVIVLLQGTVSPVAVLANLLAAPLVAPTTIAGILAAVGSMAWPPLGIACAWAGMPAAWLIGQIARWCATVPFGTIDWVPGPAGAWLLTALTVLLLVCGRWLWVTARRTPWVAAAVATLLVATSAPVPTGVRSAGEWLVVGCDVGQGDAFLVATGPARAVLIDTGMEPGLVSDCLRRTGVGALDGLVLTHFHADHVGGLQGVLDTVPVAAAYLSPVREPAEMADRVHRQLTEAGVAAYEVRGGDRMQWGQVHAEVVWPYRTIRSGSVANNASIVLDVRVREIRALFTADIEPEAARAVRARVAGEVFDVLKVAHHGSAAQDPALVRGLGARVAMIGVGADNTFGHPAHSALQLLEQSGMVVLRTDLHGDIAVVLDSAGDLAVRTARRGRRARGPPRRRGVRAAAAPRRRTRATDSLLRRQRRRPVGPTRCRPPPLPAAGVRPAGRASR